MKRDLYLHRLKDEALFCRIKFCSKQTLEFLGVSVLHHISAFSRTDNFTIGPFRKVAGGVVI